jgi:AcrR family transcriptional regulator
METNNTTDVSNELGFVSEDPQKQKIVSLASARFLQEGFSKITLDEIASELAMSKKTLYKFFANKEDLLNTVVERMMMEAQQRLSSIIGSQKTFVEKLSEILTFLGQLVRRVSKPFQRDLQLHAPEVWTRPEGYQPSGFFSVLPGCNRECGPPRGTHQRIILRPRGHRGNHPHFL